MIQKFKDTLPTLGTNTWIAPFADIVEDVTCVKIVPSGLAALSVVMFIILKLEIVSIFKILV